MRVKPDFDKKVPAEFQSKNDNWWACGQVLGICVVGYIVLSSITRVMAGRGENIDGIILPGALVFIVVALILTERNKKKEKQRLREAQQEWKRTCKLEEVVIVRRQWFAGKSYVDDYGDDHTVRPFHHLELETTADQKAVNPKLMSVTLDVYGDIYEKLENRNTVCIYYRPESPFTFLLEEELSLQ